MHGSMTSPPEVGAFQLGLTRLDCQTLSLSLSRSMSLSRSCSISRAFFISLFHTQTQCSSQGVPPGMGPPLLGLTRLDCQTIRN